MDDRERVDRALGALRDAADRHLLEAPGEPGAAAVALVPPADMPAAVLEELAGRVAELEPWEEGPFPLGPGLVAGEAAEDARRWRDLDRHLADDVAGRRVLDVGSGAGYDCFAFAARGAGEVLGCEWTHAIEQARFLEGVYSSGVTFEHQGWEGLDPERHGTFEVVHCHGVLQRVAAPMNLLGRLWRMTAPGGLLLMGSATLDAPELSRYTTFAPRTAERPAPEWCRLTLRWMVETSGFDPGEWIVERPQAGTSGPRSARTCERAAPSNARDRLTLRAASGERRRIP